MPYLAPWRAPRAAALALRPLPLAPLQPALAFLIRAILQRHPELFDRLGAHAGKRFGLDPTDLPFAFVLDTRRNDPGIRAVRTLPSNIDARIAGPFAGLFGLAAGAYDGDALLFSRDLVVEGDVAATLALRNAIEGADIAPGRDVREALHSALASMRASSRSRRSTARRKRVSPTAGRPWS